MGLEFDNENDDICKERIKKEYARALEQFLSSSKLIEEWSPQSDSVIYQACKDCSDTLFAVIEQALKKFLESKGEREVNATLKVMCEIARSYPELDKIELSIFVSRKKPRNDMTHNGKLSIMREYHRVLKNLRKLLMIIWPMENFAEIPMSNSIFDANEFLVHVENFEAESTQYILLIDRVKDIDRISLRNFMKAPWSIVVDFDDKGSDGCIFNSYPNKRDVQLCSVSGFNGQGLTSNAFKLKRTIELSLDNDTSAPALIKYWKADDKRIIDDFFIMSRILDKSKAIVTVAKHYDEVIEMLLGKIVDSYGQENVEILFVCDEFDERDRMSLDNKFESYYDFSNDDIEVAIESLAKMINNTIPEVKETTNEYVKVPGNDGIVEIKDQAFIDNINMYYEILDLSKGKNVDCLDEESFLKGEGFSWEIMNMNYDVLPIDKSVYDKYLNDIKGSLGTMSTKSKVFKLLYKPGFGGTTFSKRIAWDLHESYPVLLLQDYQNEVTIKFLTKFYEYCKKGIFVIADENNISKSDLDKFENDINTSIFPSALLLVKRDNSNEKRDNNYQIINVLSFENQRILEQKCSNLLKKNKDRHVVVERSKCLNNLKKSERCPLLISLFYLEEEFEGTEPYIEHYYEALENNDENDSIKKAMYFIAMCDYFGQKKISSSLLEYMLNPTRLKGFKIKEKLKEVSNLFVFENINNIIRIKSKHYLISEAIMKCSAPDKSKWESCLVEKSKEFIDMLISACSSSMDDDIADIIRDVFIENRYDDFIGSKFSYLIETMRNDRDKTQVFEYLAISFDELINNRRDSKTKEFQLLAHIWGHLSRLYTKNGQMKNWTKAIECGEKAINYIEKFNLKDYILYHIQGNCISKQVREILEKVADIEDLSREINNIIELVNDSVGYLNKSIQYGSAEYGLASIVQLWSKVIISIFNLLDLHNIYDCKGIESELNKHNMMIHSLWLLNGIAELLDIFDSSEVESFKDSSKSIIHNMKDEITTHYVDKTNHQTLMNLNQRLSDLEKSTSPDLDRIENVKRLIIRVILDRYKDPDTFTYSGFLEHRKRKKKHLETVMNYLEDILAGYSVFKTRDYALWMKLSRYTEKSIDEIINIAFKWFEYNKNNEIIDPMPSYYIYVLQTLRALDGYTSALEEAKKYCNICRSTYNKKINLGQYVNYSVIRDWLGVGTGAARLINGVQYEDVLQSEQIMQVRGCLTDLENDNRLTSGFLTISEPAGLKGQKVFFNPAEAKVTASQMKHMFSFKMGFTLERLVAFNKSLVDLTLT